MEKPELKQAVFESLMQLAVQNKFNGLEKPRQLQLLKDPFTVESDVLTPTMKLKRNVAKKMYEETLLKLYEMPVLAMTKK